MEKKAAKEEAPRDQEGQEGGEGASGRKRHCLSEKKDDKTKTYYNI